MRVRGPYDPEDAEPDGEPPGWRRPPAGSRDFRVPTWVIVAKFGGGGALALAGLLTGERVPGAVGLLAAVGFALYGLRDVLARDRLHADGQGVTTVRGFAGRRHLDWSQIERIRLDERLRFGARTQLLELDAGDEIYLLSRFDLGAEPREVLRVLTALRPTG